ncbi:MAG: proline/glycine betaine ABC transporter permease [Pseudomonadota bacterium]
MATTAEPGAIPGPSAADDSGAAPSADLIDSIKAFAGTNGDYYADHFVRIQSARGFPWSFNHMAAVLGPLWAAARGLWGFFWTFAIIDLFALVQLGRGLWGDLGADQLERAERLQEKSSAMAAKAQAALESGSSSAEALQRNADNLQKAANKALAAAEQAAAGATTLLIVGLIMVAAVMLAQGFLANMSYEKKYGRWRIDHSEGGGIRIQDVLFGIAMIVIMYPLTLYRFTVSKPAEILTAFPSDKELFNNTANWLEGWFDYIAVEGADVFDGITAAIRGLLDGLEVILVGTPWPVTMLVIVVLAWRLAGPRVAIFTCAALAYLAFLGYWEQSMATVALLGAAAILCVAMGIPLGIWCAKSRTAYAVARPVLDFMQTMPSFVYLIPVIAFFGTGKPPGILATIVFGMPPVVRLTALGIKGVPESIKEAAIAFGCTKRKLLFDVELPLATPSIMTGVNQTILMCLSMVVIAALIGAGGLGSDVLEALQYAAKGQGLLAGLAILFCAMIIDRIVQGKFKRED